MLEARETPRVDDYELRDAIFGDLGWPVAERATRPDESGRRPATRGSDAQVTEALGDCRKVSSVSPWDPLVPKASRNIRALTAILELAVRPATADGRTPPRAQVDTRPPRG
jgi:hypothetical protein